VTGPQARVKSMVKVMWSMRFMVSFGWWLVSVDAVNLPLRLRKCNKKKPAREK